MMGAGGGNSVDHMGEGGGRDAGGVWIGGTVGRMTPALLCDRRGRGGGGGDFVVEMGASGGDQVDMGDSSPDWVLCAQAEMREPPPCPLARLPSQPFC